MKIGILALQGNFASHSNLIERLGAQTVLVKTSKQLEDIHGLVIPGGNDSNNEGRRM